MWESETMNKIKVAEILFHIRISRNAKCKTKGAKHEALPQDGKNLKTIVRPRCAFPIPKEL